MSLVVPLNSLLEGGFQCLADGRSRIDDRRVVGLCDTTPYQQDKQSNESICEQSRLRLMTSSRAHQQIGRRFFCGDTELDSTNHHEKRGHPKFKDAMTAKKKNEIWNHNSNKSQLARNAILDKQESIFEVGSKRSYIKFSHK